MAPGAGFRTSRRRRSPGAMMRLVAPLSWLAALLLGTAFWWADVLMGVSLITDVLDWSA